MSSAAGDMYLGIGASAYSASGIYIGTTSTGNRFSIVGANNNKLLWDGLTLGISSSNFTLSQGNITATNVNLSGTITSSAGIIGGWTISSDKMNSLGMTISARTNMPYIAISQSTIGSNNPGLFFGY